MALNISKFLDQFFMEAKEKLESIQANMAELEQDPRRKEPIMAIQRDMHTIKGSSRMVGLKEISEIAHLMEEAFIQLNSERIQVTEEVMTILYKGIDGVSELLDASQNKQTGVRQPLLLEQLQQVIDGKIVNAEKKAESAEDGPIKKKFKLDLDVLKSKYQKKIPGSHWPEPPKEKAAASPPTEITSTPRSETTATGELENIENKPISSGIKSANLEKTHLKVDSIQVETAINQVTDLLSKRYFFNNVLVNFRELSRLTRGLRKEWQSLKTGGTNAFHSQINMDTLNNVDNIVDTFFRRIQEYERDYQVNLSIFENALRDVYDNLLDMKMTPLSAIFNIYPRFVRDYAHRSGKKIRIYLRGGDTQLDKTVIEKINEPLIHLVRNACDHGIEAPDSREKKGKPAIGTIIIEANKKGNHVEIKITDDGNGLDRNLILKKAIERGLVDKKIAERLEDSEIFDFIFLPGFSTVENVSDISGRGIGMDIVKKITYQFGGSVSISSELGKGTTCVMEFPVSIFTNKVTYIREEGNTYALPGNLIRRIVKLKPEDIQEKSDYSVVVYNDEIYTVAKLNQVLKGDTTGVGKHPVFMILPKPTDRKIGIIVDEIICEAEVIIKDLGKFLGKRKYVYGMVVGDKGELHIVLDIHDIVSSAEFSKKIKIISPFKPKKSSKRRILVVDDSLLVREMERNLLEGAGYDVVTGINGLDGYSKALAQRFDLVLADIEMPEMDGFEMIENIKKINEYADVPTIVLSTVDREQDKVRGINLGVNAWLQKQDFNDTEMLKVVKRFIG